MSSKSSELIMDIARQPHRLHDVDAFIGQSDSSLPPRTRCYKNEQSLDWEDEFNDPPPPYESYDLSNTILIDDYLDPSTSCKFWHTASSIAPLVLSTCDTCNDLVDFILFPENNDDFDLDDDTSSILSSSSASSSIVSCDTGISLSTLSSASVRPATPPMDQPADILSCGDLASRKQDDACQQCKEDAVDDWLGNVIHPGQDEVVGLAVDLAR